MTKILLIEPNGTHAKLMVERLRSELTGAHIDEAPNLKGGMTLLSRQSYDCILTNASTPEGSGSRLIQTLRKAGGSTPIIVVTGRTDGRLASDALRNGATDYVFKSRETLETIGEVVRKNIIKNQARKRLLIPAHVLGKILDEIERTVSRDVRAKIRRIRRNTGKLLNLS